MGNWQALVIQKVDNAIHCINHYPADNALGIHNTYPHWIVIYPVDCATEHLINRGQNCNVDVADKRTTALVLFNSKLRLFAVPYFFVRSFRYTASYRHGYLDFQMYRAGGRRGL